MKTLIAVLLTAITLFAGIRVGQEFPISVLPDQFDNLIPVEAEDTLVIVSFEKDISGAIHDYLKTKPEGFLYKHQAKYISDISPMPTVITNMFALPKMREYGYPVMLIYDKRGGRLDKRDGKVTVYRLDKGRVTAVDFIAPSALPKLFGE